MEGNTEMRVFRAANGRAPLAEWLAKLKKRKPKIWRQCIQRIRDLAREGYRLQRPLAAPLRDGIHELRCKNGSPNYRILYFFYRGIGVLTHGLTKDREVPDEDIEHAIYCRRLVERDDDKYTADFG